MTNTKITKKDRYTEMSAIFADMGRDDLAGFCDHELELLAKKNAGKTKVSAAEQEKRDNIAAAVVDILTNSVDPIPNAEIAKAMPADFGTISTQKLTPILTKLTKDGVINAEKVKGRTVYSIA